MEVGKVWRDLLVEIFDNVLPFMSDKDIAAGTRNLPTIANELNGSRFGIVIVTQENLHSQWLNYEVGALSKDVTDPTLRVAPSLVDFASEADATGPLSQFQATLLSESGVAEILEQIGKAVGSDIAIVQKRFGRAWDDEFKRRFEEAKSPLSQPTSNSRREQEAVLDEILTLVRDLARDKPSNPVPPGDQALTNSNLREARKILIAKLVRELKDDLPETWWSLNTQPDDYEYIQLRVSEPIQSEVESKFRRGLREIGVTNFFVDVMDNPAEGLHPVDN